MNQKSVAVVGAGIIGLLSAYEVHNAGFKVSVFDAGPDTLGTYNRTNTGATFSGADARHVSATETAPHASSSMQGQIYKSVAEGGWLAKELNLLTPQEKIWMSDFNNLTKKSNLFNKYSSMVAKVNNKSKDLWRELMKKDPELFKETYVNETITVFFLDRETFKSELLIEQKANPLFPPEPLNKYEILKRFPFMKEPLEKGIVVGALVLDGFSIHAITFCRNVISYLKDNGVNFFWNKKINTLKDLKTNSDYFLISTGTETTEKVMGVTGVWIKIPNMGFTNPFKIAAPYPTGYINGTIHEDSLLLSGGYGFIGRDLRDEKGERIQILFKDIKKNIEKVFPEEYKKALKENTLDEKACVRPMKASGLGVFEVDENIIYAGGNNAGGFTQAPVVAKAVLEVISKKKCSLLKDYAQDSETIFSN